ncbi:hypothetical protein D3C78_854470 [compost metagenome]
MVITLIPEPVVFAHLNQLMKCQRLAAVDTQVLIKIGLHQRHRRRVRRGVMTHIDNLRLSENHRLINPLPHVAVVFAKARAQGIGLHHARHYRFSQQRRVDFPVQLGVVRHAPGVWQR